MTTTSTHSYAARVLDPAGDIVLPLDERAGGDVTLDASSIPHASGRITLAVEDPMLLESLDPRDSRRVVIDATGELSSGTVQRSFDLGIRSATPNRAEGTVTLDLASDEALLQDYAPLVDDSTPRGFESSIRAVCDYVLNRVPGVQRNLEANSRALSSGETSAYGNRFGWTRSFLTSPTSPTDLPFNTVCRITSTESGLVQGRGFHSYGNPDSVAPSTPDYLTGPVLTPGQKITVSRYIRAVFFTGTVQFQVLVRFHDRNGNWVSANNIGDYTAPAGTHVWHRPSWTGVVPEGAVAMSVRTTSSTFTVQSSGADGATLIDMTGLLTEAADSVRPWREALEPGPDADVTAYWPVSNLVSNPSFESNMDGWAAGTNATTPGRFSDTAQGEVSGAWVARWASNGAGSSYIDYQDISITPGSAYVLSAYMYSENAARNGRVMMRFKAGNGAILRDVYGTTTALKSAAWTRLSVMATAPPGATKATLHLEHIATAASQGARADGVMFYEGNEIIPYFDGATTDSATYDYAWTGTAHASNATRTPLLERQPEVLTWSAGVSAMSFLEPLLKASGLRLVCDEQRRWTLRDANYRASGDQAYRYGVNIETADETLSRDDDAWFDAAVYEYIWTDKTGAEKRRVDAWSLTGTPTKVLRVEVRSPFPGVGRAENIVRRAQSRGRTVTVSAIPTWQEHTDQTLSVLLEGTEIQTGISGSVRFDFGNDTVTVSSRTADTPAAAWILTPAAQRWIDSPTGGTWKNEVI